MPIRLIRSINSLTGKDGAIKRIEADGFTCGIAHEFRFVHLGREKSLEPLVIMGSVVAIALLTSYFIPVLALPSFVLMTIASACLYVISSNMLYKILALGASVSMPTVAIILGCRKLQRRSEDTDATTMDTQIAVMLRLFIMTTIFSLTGGALVVGLLNAPIYNLLDQFTGVKILALHADPTGCRLSAVFYRRCFVPGYHREITTAFSHHQQPTFGADGCWWPG